MKWKNLTVSQILDQAAEQRPDHEVLYDLFRRMTYCELQEEVEALAAALVRMGVRKGERIGVCLPNWHETAAIYLAVAKIGAIVVPFNTRYRSHEVAHIVQNAQTKVVFVCEEFAEHIGIDLLLPLVEHVVTVRFKRSEAADYAQLLLEGRGGTLPVVDIDPVEDVFCILYTSGTTGFPKGAMLTHQNVIYTAAQTVETLACGAEDVFLVPVPLFHVFGMISCFMSTLLSQARMVLQEKYKAVDALRLIEQERVTVHHAVPTMFILELNHPDFSTFNLSSLRTGIIAAAPCPAETIKQLREKMGLNICVSYGATETSAAVTFTLLDDEETNILETVGKGAFEAEIKIVNDQKETLEAGQVGEIVCRSLGVMKGYYQAPEQTHQALDTEGWYYTGDLGTLDQNGYLRIVGRKKEMIIRGGYNIYPREIEELLYRHPKIMEAAVVGLPDSVMGEIVCAAVRLRENAVATEEEMKSYLKQQLADYKVPNRIVFVDDLPLTASGKIQKGRLKDRLMETYEPR
ncbi:long-chain fatty acid--CoA ligase [Brevibacillus fluminis]|uniref:Long-chain fatty acid--CoA ligase n=1 Tax=Brevibacillus fluminis TaxID=511487 RepID=A0A3M8DNK5_9BACL|nr:class I adenylate-forming enzyme family protein [Brevibacillus fluminis]RNB89680.1 long-chain fatty acid--CoA ligase [Brevibacillus fluminis]